MAVHSCWPLNVNSDCRQRHCCQLEVSAAVRDWSDFCWSSTQIFISLSHGSHGCKFPRVLQEMKRCASERHEWSSHPSRLHREKKKNLHENKGVQIAVKVEIQLQARVQHFHCCFYYISCWVWIVGESPLHSLTKTGSLIQKPESQIQFFSWIDDLPRNKETRLRTGNTESQHLRFCSSSSQAKPCKISSKKASLYELSF